ncbi:MAG: ATP-binding protein [Deltaproteobacteria bacterium]|nr:ATP-binding protein [Deltaproteobacteria bacterium]
MHVNPFTLKEIPAGSAFCDRQKELKDLTGFASAGENVLLYSPRRYGKTSLVRKVQGHLESDGAITAYCDLFGVSSIEDIAGRIARSIYTITRKDESLFQKAIRFLSSFRPVLSPSPDGGVAVSVQPAYRSGSLELLENTMEALDKFVEDVSNLVHVALDEFQEITEIEDSIRIEGRLRHYIQRMRCGFVFVGSRRRILLEMFNDRKRPFFQSTINYELSTLPREELIDFMVSRFEEAGKALSRDLGVRICDLLGQHPYYIQKFCFFLFDRTEHTVMPEEVSEIYQLVLESERALFEAVLRRLTATQISVLTAIAKEPTKRLFAAEYMARHSLKSTGGIQRSLSVLTGEDLVEQHTADGTWTVVDSLLGQWLVEKAL